MLKIWANRVELLTLFGRFFLRALVYMLVGFTLMSCGGQEEESTVTFALGPSSVTVLNVSASNCLDLLSGTSPPPTSAAAGVIFLDNIKITWANTNRDLRFYGIRFFAKSPALKGGKAEAMITGANLASLFRLDDFCGANCVLSRTTSSVPTRSLWIRGGVSAKLYLDGSTTSSADACAPVVGGFTFNSNVTSQVSFPISVTLYAYSVDDEGNIKNEYASASLTANYQPPPQ